MKWPKHRYEYLFFLNAFLVIVANHVIFNGKCDVQRDTAHKICRLLWYPIFAPVTLKENRLEQIFM